MTFELLREKNTRNGEFRDSSDHNHISIEGTGDDLALKFTHLDTFKSGNWLYKDYNDWVYRINIAIELAPSISRYIEFTVRIIPDCSDLEMKKDDQVITPLYYVPLLANTEERVNFPSYKFGYDTTTCGEPDFEYKLL